MRERVFLAGGKVLVQVVDVHLRRRKRLAGRDVKVADNLVDGKMAGDVASLFSHTL